MYPAAMENDPKKPGFSPQRFFADLKRDSDYGNIVLAAVACLACLTFVAGASLSKYVLKVQYYFDNHLLEPNNAILGACPSSHCLFFASRFHACPSLLFF
jgi:hypothetical protein